MPRFGADFWWMLGFAALVCGIGSFTTVQQLVNRWALRETIGALPSVIVGLLAAILLVLSAAVVVSSGFNPFIYFRF
jgi:asparagine N-glycosylation enzyme membrane subunit Stt3